MSKSEITFRTSKRLPRSLDSRLKSYAMAAGVTGVSLLALTPAHAQIIYTSVHTYIPSRYYPTYLDINNDGIPDVRFSNFFGSFSHAASEFLQVEGLTGGMMALSAGSASALPKGAMIGPSGRFVKGNCFMAGTYALAYGNTYFHDYFGPWNDVNNRFLGVSFSVNGETHYGWIRMNVDTHVVRKVRAVMTGYAYESAADTPIKAGQTSGNSDDDSGDATMLQPSAFSGASLGMLAGGADYRHSAIHLYDVCRTQPK
jgi:hypothetical protein